ncbi:MAG: type II secretion system protein M [Gammaproteobacteria bacterium]
MKTWLEKLTRREQLAVVIAALTVIGFSLYLFYWQPMNAEQDRLRTHLAEQFEALVWMQQAAEEVRQLRGENRSMPQERTQESLLALVDRTARATIADGINRLEPDGEHAVKLWLKDVSFDSLLPWLQELQTAWGVQTTVVSLHRAEQPGLVTGRLVLEEAAE